MPLNFPSHLDVRLGKSPLAEVVCQVRFPPVLRITTRTPAEFQDLVRYRFPFHEMEQGLRVRLLTLGADQTADAETTTRLHRFRTTDESTAITLGTDAYAVSTTNYTFWEDFARDLAIAHEAAMAAYQMPFYTRIGLRYVNALTPASTDLGTLPELATLLQPALTALFETDAWTLPLDSISQMLLDDGPGKLVFRVAARSDIGDGSPLVLLDLDYFEEGELPVTDLLERCKRYHDVIYDAFRWAISDKALTAFQPVITEEGPDNGTHG